MLVYITEPYPGADDLLWAVRKHPMKISLTPGKGSNRSQLFGRFPNGNIVLPFSNLLAKASSYIEKEIIESKMGGFFTTGVIHKNYGGMPHYDSGSVEGTPTAVLVLRDPGSRDGRLYFPELDVSLPMPHGTICIFDGGKLRHGTTETKGGDRYSIIFHTRRGL